MVLDRPRKLNYLATKRIYYRLLNTSCMFTNSCCIYCRHDQFRGCRSKPLNSMLADRNHCYIYRVGVTYDEEKIKNLRKIVDVTNNFLNIKEDIQLCINFDSRCN